MTIRKFSLLCALSISLYACIVNSDPRAAFFQNIGADVGKKTDDPSTWFFHYQKNRKSNTGTESGNIEYEYDWGPLCVTYYEVDPPSKTIVGWRMHDTVNRGCSSGG